MSPKPRPKIYKLNVEDDDLLSQYQREIILEEFGDPDDLALSEDGTIVDGRGNPLIRPY